MATLSARLAGNHASPHSLDVYGNPAVATIDKSDSIYFARPAGGAWSNAHDLALYALNELREGALPNGKRIVTAENLLARRNQGMETGEATRYGMGIETTSRLGVPMVHHGVAMPGYKTDWVILPEAGIGVVMLSNGEEGTPILIGRGGAWWSCCMARAKRRLPRLPPLPRVTAPISPKSAAGCRSRQIR